MGDHTARGIVYTGPPYAAQKNSILSIFLSRTMSRYQARCFRPLRSATPDGCTPQQAAPDDKTGEFHNYGKSILTPFSAHLTKDQQANGEREDMNKEEKISSVRYVTGIFLMTTILWSARSAARRITATAGTVSGTAAWSSITVPICSMT